MKFFNLIISSMVLMLGISSCSQDACSTKDQFVDSSNAFFEEFKEKSSDLSKKDISAYEERYENLLENCYKKFKDDMSIDERRDFWRSTINFYINKEGGVFNLKFNGDYEDDPVRKYIIDEFEEMSDSTAQEFSQFLEDLLEDELPNLIDSFVDKVEEIGEEIKNSLEESKK